MKVLYLTNIPSPYRVAYFNELGKYCDLTVIFEKEGYITRDKSWLDYKFENFKGFFLPGIEIGLYEKLTFAFVKYLKKEKYDHVIVTNMGTLTGVLAVHWMKLKNIPYCIEGDGGIAGSRKGIKEKIKTGMISTAKMCFSTSKEHDKYYCQYGAMPNNIRRYPFTSLHAKDILAAPIDNEEKLDIKRKLGISEKRIILSIGSFIPRKGMDLLIKATSKIRGDWGIYIIGGEATEEYLELKKTYQNQNLYFIDFMKPEKLSDYFKAADLFVLATREDIWGLVINEAMAYALPVITTNKCVAGQELVKNGENGYIVESENIEELREKINILIGSEDMLNACSKKSLETIRDYTIEKMAETHMKIFSTDDKSDGVMV